MASSFLKRLFGDSSTKELKKIEPLVKAVEALEDQYSALSDEALKAKTQEFKDRYQKGETLEDLLPEAFAACREAAWRVLGMKPYRVQVIGGIVLHQGRIAEMKTGEGKTLVATMPAYLNALTGRGVHIVTVNDYLAKRDSDWMGKVYRWMGLTCGTILHEMNNDQRRAAYACDITYGTNNELGFDYLRDNMAIYKRDMVQRGHVFAIVDEVDSILIDEARTPLIISGQGDKSTDLYKQADDFVRTLSSLKVVEVDAKESQDDIEADYIIDEKGKTATITPRGVTKAEKYFHVDNLTDPENTTLMHHINQAIKAHGCMKRDVDYVVRDGQIIIVDEFTGRLMFGRRYNEGLHQAIEAKEKVTVLRESKTLATITFQNFFRLYEKLSGMTGTALTEEDEFRQIYKLDVIEIPTNKPLQRKDLPDAVYKTEQGKYRAVINKIIECNKKGQPVLVGTISIEKSEQLSKMLKREGIKHQVLNAKYHEKEAAIVAQAGKPYAVTIATNMAGRGTDIMLGGNPEAMAREDLVRAGYPEEIIAEATGYADTDNPDILAARENYKQSLKKYEESTKKDAEFVRQAGGLCIIGTERHESRRIDNQLRGRAGRQGDPGESRFYISLEDDLMRLFGSDRISGMLDKLGLDDDTPIDQKILSNAIESAQSKVEGRNFQSRKYTLDYDDVMNRQREIIYDQRRKVLDGENLKSSIQAMIRDSVARSVQSVVGEHNYLDTWQAEEIVKRWEKVFLQPGEMTFTPEDLDKLTPKELIEQLQEKAMAVYEAKEQQLGEQLMRELERVILLKVVDTHWMDHIDAMHELRRGIGLQAYAQQDPVVAYKREGFDMFDEMINEIKDDTARTIFIARVVGQNAPQREQMMKPTATAGADDGSRTKQPVRSGKKPGRNDPCPCGSGLKYKKCCGKNE
ncbi:MAG TPA: preprotein translocase subunit SecA [Firmicutes bacterium]|nr:preprotein translocase subunit SecA [Bacillota bacterium]